MSQAPERAEIRVRGLPAAEPRALLPRGRRLVLYPSPGARVLSHTEHAGQDVILLVPDGNWSQAQRTARRDPDMEGAEHVALPAGPPTRYLLRRGAEPGRVCTLEAIARAIGILEGPAAQTALEAVLETFIDRALSVGGRSRVRLARSVTSVDIE